MGRLLEKSLKLVVSIVSLMVGVFSWCAHKLEDHYDGRIAGIPQTVFALGVAGIVFSPFVVYTILLSWQLQPPYCYFAFAIYAGFIGALAAGAAYMDYTRGQATVSSLSKDFRWDIDKFAKDYIDMVDKRQLKNEKLFNSRKKRKSSDA